MDNILQEYDQYLKNEKKMAQNSIEAYHRDIADFESFLKNREDPSILHANSASVSAYVLALKESGKSASTIRRRAASIRSLFNYLAEQGKIEGNPAAQLKMPRVKKRSPEFLSVKEVEQLLEQPDDSGKGNRDRAILELLYATGMRVTELVDLDVEDVNIRMGFVSCRGENGKIRIIPLGRPAREAIDRYLSGVRPSLLRKKQELALFLNFSGERLSRQGVWKMIKHYANHIGVEEKITPQILRHSFAMHMIQNGADIKSLQELLGHEDLSATQVYLAASKNRIKEVYDKAHPRA